jgi:hypothetical protein
MEASPAVVGGVLDTIDHSCANPATGSTSVKGIDCECNWASNVSELVEVD